MSWALYHFFKNDHPYLSSVVALLRFLYTVLLSISVTNLIQALSVSQQLNNGLLLETVEPLFYHFLYSFEITWQFSLIAFSLHLASLALITWKEVHFPKWLSILLGIAALGYLLNHSLLLIFTSENQLVQLLEQIFTLPMIIGEVGIAIWFIYQSIVVKSTKNTFIH